MNKPVQPKGDLGPPPKHMDAVSKKLWDNIRQWYGSLKVVSDADRQHIEIFCKAFSDYRKYTTEIKRHGAWYEMHTGSIRLHPRVHMRDRAIQVIHKIGSELGFSPVARQKLMDPQGSGDDELEKMFTGEQ